MKCKDTNWSIFTVYIFDIILNRTQFIFSVSFSNNNYNNNKKQFK